MISCVLLTAGLSERFGSPKALAPLGDSTAIGRLQKTLIPSQVAEVIVVLGAYADQIKPLLQNHLKIKEVYNKNYLLGQTSSFKAGVELVSPRSTGIMLLPVDVPLVKTGTLNMLIDQFEAKNPPILIPTHQGRRGHPPIFHQKLKDQILAMDNTVGLNVFEHEHQPEVILVEVDDEGILKTFNTPEEFQRLNS